MKAIVIFCFLMSSAIFSNAQSYTGVWSGYMYVTDNEVEIKMPFVLEIQNNGNGNYTGRTILNGQWKGEEYHIQCRLKGSVSGAGFTFTDGDKIESTEPPAPTDFYWCVKTGTLKLNIIPGEPKTLTGEITGNSTRGICLSGRVELTYRGNSH